MMNVLSLFDGISCGRVALERLNINIHCYYASEIDPFAITISKKNYPDTIHLGDIENWKSWDLPWDTIDLVIGGSPCQGFSLAGKQLAFEDPRSKLFFVFVDILNHIQKLNPKVKFLLENVRMESWCIKVISRYLEVEPIFINSALVSAQNRPRYYWCNWKVTLPKDKNIVLKDIIEDVHFSHIYQKGRGNNKGGKFYSKSPTLTSSRWEQNNILYLEEVLCPPKWVEWWYKNRDFQERKRYSQVCNGKEKAITLTARMYGAWNGNFIELRDSPSCIGNVNPSGRGMNGQVYSIHSKSATLTTNKGEGSKIGVRAAALRGRSCGQHLEIRPDNKSNTLTSNPRKSVLTLAGYAQNIGANNYQAISRVYKTEGKAPSLLSSPGGNKEPKVAIDSVRWRTLTPIECERLQTLPDNYTEGVSKTQRFISLGNAWTVDVIAHILSQMNDSTHGITQLSLFSTPNDNLKESNNGSKYHTTNIK